MVPRQNQQVQKDRSDMMTIDNLLDLPFASPQEQLLTNIKNWVNSYCELSEKAPSELVFRKIIVAINKNGMEA